MKKSLLALAVLGAFAGAAQAQSAVTIYGSIDSGVRYTSNNDAAGHSKFALNTGTFNSNRLGFKGVEDLGGGLNAHFNVESGFNVKNGNQATAGVLFDRGAFVGLGGAWGSLDFGNQYSISFKTIGTYDPFSYKYIGIIPLAAASAGNQAQPTYVTTNVTGSARFNNDVQYSGKFGPITAYAEHAFGEQNGSFGNAAANAVGAVYADGPITVGGAYTVRKPNAANFGVPGVTGFQDNKHWTIGGAFTTGPVRIAAGYISEKQDLASGVDATTKNAWVGGSYNLSSEAALTAGYYETKFSATGGTDTKRKLLIVGGTYALSKRTNLYANIDNAKFSGNTTFTTVNTGVNPIAASQPTGKTTQTGVSVGVAHVF